MALRYFDVPTRSTSTTYQGVVPLDQRLAGLHPSSSATDRTRWTRPRRGRRARERARRAPRSRCSTSATASRRPLRGRRAVAGGDRLGHQRRARVHRRRPPLSGVGWRMSGAHGGCSASRATTSRSCTISSPGGRTRRPPIASRTDPEIPIALPAAQRGRGGAAGRRDPVRLGDAAEVAAFEEWPLRRHAARLRRVETRDHLRLALRAVGVELSDKVVAVTHAYVATANADPLLRRRAGVVRRRPRASCNIDPIRWTSAR